MTIILLYFKQILIVELITYTALQLGSKHQTLHNPLSL